MCHRLFPKAKSECTIIIYKNHVIIIKSCNYIFEIIKLYLYQIYVVILFAQPIHVLITLQYELDIYILGSNTAWRGWGSCSETLPYSKFRHISWEQMMTEHRGISVKIAGEVYNHLLVIRTEWILLECGCVHLLIVNHYSTILRDTPHVAYQLAMGWRHNQPKNHHFYCGSLKCPLVYISID